MRHPSNQRGFVSILSVIFFILLMSVLTIGFLRIMADEQSQVIDNDLSKGALASAESGVEDAKRALVYCRSLPTGPARTTCYQALNNSNCPGMFGDTVQASGGVNPLPAALGLDKTAGDGSVRVGNITNNQRYTCVVTSLQTRDVIGQASEEGGEFIPIRSTSPFNRITVYWHQTATDGAATLPGVGDMSDNYRYSSWTNGVARFVSGLRLQLVEFDRSKTLSQMNDSSAGMFLMPTSVAAAPPVAYSTTPPLLNLGAAITTASVGDKRVEVTCNTAAATAQGYACAMSMAVPTNTPGDTKDWYMLVKSIYGSPHYKLEISNGANSVLFDDAQPEVDSTGATGDVFRRIISRVSYGDEAFNTTNALESGVSICKDFFATDNNSVFSACPTNTPPVGGGNAGVGGICDLDPTACNAGGGGGGGGGGTTPAWDTTIVNLSNNNPALILGCTWDFGDGAANIETYTTPPGGPPPARCLYQAQFKHTFPSDPAYDGPPDPVKKTYNVVLTMKLTTGTVIDSLPFYMPRYK